MSLETPQLDFAEIVDLHRRQGWGWRYDGLTSWPIEKIFAQLQELKIDTDADRFRDQAVSAVRFETMRVDWNRQLIANHTDSGFWPDFPLIAVPELWERLASDVMCPDLVERRLYLAIQAEDDGESPAHVDGIPAGLAAAMKLVRYLQPFGPAERAELYRQIDRDDGICVYSEWLSELVFEHGSDHPDLLTELVDVLSDCDFPPRFQSDLAVALATAGRHDQAIARALANAERHPTDVWIRIFVGDVFRELHDDPQAIQHWLQALAMARESYDWEGAVERLEDAFDRTGRKSELPEILLSHPMPQRAFVVRQKTFSPPQKPAAAEWSAPSMQQLVSAKSVGRNDPCPCGSGKKYKKCCLP